MTHNDPRVWRDEDRLPLTELERAMGSPAADGQLDDVTGNEAGAESAFGHGAEADDPYLPRTGPGDREPNQESTDEQRRNRPSTTGRTGPH